MGGNNSFGFGTNDTEGRVVIADFVDCHLNCDLRIMNANDNRTDNFIYLDSDDDDIIEVREMEEGK